MIIYTVTQHKAPPPMVMN